MSVLQEITPVVHTPSPPVIVVGLPRSGSTYLTHVLSCMDGLYIFDDLYPYQGAKALNLKGVLSLEQQQAFLNKLSWSARAKIRFKKNIYAFAPQCTWEEIDDLEASVLKAFEDQSVTWPMVLEEWMTRLALHHDCQRWGYKTPQDFMHLDELSQIFPEAQFIFVMRDPRKVMASFKNLPLKRVKGQSFDGVAGQYHPLVYANYWKMAYQKTKSFIDNNPQVNVCMVKFEDLIAEPDHEASRIAEFVNTSVSQSVRVERVNTSFSDKERRDVTDTEVWLCELMAGKVMREAGYDLLDTKPKLSDVIDLIRTTSIFSSYQVSRIFQDGRARQSIMNYLKNLT